MSHFHVPYVPLQKAVGSDLVDLPVTVYYFMGNKRLLAETLTVMIHKDDIADGYDVTGYTLNIQERNSPEKFKRILHSHKILVHYTKSDQWICLKDRESAQEYSRYWPRSYEITGKEKTFLALAAETV